MLQEENEAYEPYTPSYQQGPFEPVAVLENPTDTHAPAEQDTSPLPLIPQGPKHPLPPQNRQGRGGAILLFTLVLAIIFAVGLFAGLEYAGSTGSASSKSSTATTSKAAVTTSTSSSSASSIEAQQEAAIAKIEPAVVELDVITPQGEQIGSGVIIDSKGDIVTNYHIVNGEESITAVLYNGSKEQAQLVGTNTSDDLAVVRIQPFSNMTVAQIGNSSKLVVGQEVLAIGNPLGITETATKGIVSALNRSVTESTGTTISNAIQTDAAVNPGNSGGALINLQGQLIGIPTLTAVNTESNTAANGVSFAIPSNLVQTIVQQILQQ
ncbi:MAG TPA: trypsin-like peptidase domain-containing protein [Ktedonobacteraceae bacterium]|nr:trypsin-like peptidase domain-containing protein [Ktedonobacteraceae bacterium]